MGPGAVVAAAVAVAVAVEVVVVVVVVVRWRVLREWRLRRTRRPGTWVVSVSVSGGAHTMALSSRVWVRKLVEIHAGGW